MVWAGLRVSRVLGFAGEEAELIEVSASRAAIRLRSARFSACGRGREEGGKGGVGVGQEAVVGMPLETRRWWCGTGRGGVGQEVVVPLEMRRRCQSEAWNSGGFMRARQVSDAETSHLSLSEHL
jgi:hypothetical protein